jgi:aspartyl-tRNA(Asn)/glutamyl-tRNA(Gln) amidotransferase subunit C
MGDRLDKESVRHVAILARLRLNDEEVARFSGELSSILGYVAQLDELDTADVPPTAHPLPVSNVFREDTVRLSWSTEQALKNAPTQQDGFFKVPKVLEQESP